MSRRSFVLLLLDMIDCIEKLAMNILILIAKFYGWLFLLKSLI